MLLIRPEQMEALKQVALGTFESEMVEHLADFSPPLFKAVGERQLREAIRFGIDKARDYGFTLRGPVRTYLELMLLFGSRFDNDPQYPWAAAILADAGPQEEMQRAERLYEGAQDYRAAVGGPDDAFTLAALRNIRALSREPPGLSSQSFLRDMLWQIERVHPEKAAYVGPEALEALIREGVEQARRHGLATLDGAALIAVLMLAFGRGCTEDPLYPWIAKTLNDPAIVDPAARTQRLQKKALTWLDHVLAEFDDGAPA